MKYNYLIYYIRVDSGETVGHGNRCIELSHEISKDDIENLYKVIDEEAQSFANIKIRQSKSIIANIIKLA